MKKYEAYKNSGIEWIGQIPEGWSVVPLKYNLSLKGRIGWNGLKSEEFQEKSYAYLVTGQDFNSDVVNWEKCYQINKERYDEDPFIQLENGDLLVTKDGTIGKVAKVVNLDKPACLNSGIFVVKQTKGVFEQNYLYWVLVSNQLKEFVGFNSTGSTIAHLYQNVFENMPLTVPTFTEQKAIASYLDYKVGQIDASISAISTQIDDLKSYRQSIISEAVTKGLNPDVPMKDSGVEWIGEIPEGWTIIREKFLMNNYKSGPFGSSLITDKLLERGNILVYTPEHIAKKTTSIENNLYLPEERRNEMSQFFVKPGEIVFPIVGTLGRAMEITKDMPEGIINQRLAKFSINRNRLDVKFFLYLLTDCQLYKDYVYENCRGSIIVNLTKEILSDMPVILPPLFEQQSIVTYLETKVSKIDSAISSLEAQRDDLNTLKQSIISEAVTGKIDVRDWKPNK